MINDLRFAVRLLIRNPGFLTMIVVVLAIGIGANTAIFSIVNAVLLRPLPYPQPERLYTISERETTRVSPLRFDSWRGNNAFEHLAAASVPAFNVKIGDTLTRSFGAAVTSNFFTAFGVDFSMGRSFLSGEDRPGGPRVAIASHWFWTNLLGADAQAVGRPIVINGEPHILIGVLPESFRFPLRFDLYTPLAYDARDWSTPRQTLYAFGRLKSGVTAEAAQASLGERIRLIGLQEQIVSGFKPALGVFQAAVAMVLLIACANVANLLLARASTRRREMAIRASLGASGGRLARQLLTESLLLAGIGGILGVFVAAWSLDSLVAALPAGLTFGSWIIDPRDVRIDGAALAFAAFCALSTAVLFGLAPALDVQRASLAEAVKRGRSRIKSALVVAEVALALVLVTSAVLLGQTLVRLLDEDPGYRPSSLFRARIARNTPEGHRQFNEQLLERLKNLPGVETAAMINGLPLSGFGATFPFRIEGRPAPPPDRMPEADTRIVTADYLAAMRAPIIRGRWFTDADTDKSTAAVVVSDAFARRWLPGEDPVGKRMRVRYIGREYPVEIAGVVGDIRYTALTAEPQAVLYGFWRQFPFGQLELRDIAIRSRSEAGALLSAVRREVAALDPEVPVYLTGSMEEALGASLARPRFSMWLVGVFASVALALAALGLYGVLSYAVGERTREIGIRMALGADRSRLLKMILREGAVLAIAGVAIGLAGSLAAVRLISAMLYGAHPDPFAFLAGSIVLLAVSCAAALIPARRAARVDPMEALRHD